MSKLFEISILDCGRNYECAGWLILGVYALIMAGDRICTAGYTCDKAWKGRILHVDSHKVIAVISYYDVRWVIYELQNHLCKIFYKISQLVGNLPIVSLVELRHYPFPGNPQVARRTILESASC